MTAVLAKTEPPRKRDVRAVASMRETCGSAIARRLSGVSDVAGSIVGIAQAVRLSRCADAGNLWVGDELHREDTGELYEATGQLWACGSKLCPSCAAREASKARRRARAGVERCRPLESFNHRWRGGTLTMPNDASRQATEGVRLINRAFRRLINREFWKSRVRGGMKGIEFTVTENGKHVHIHFLILSDFIPVNAEWESRMEGYAKRRGLAPGNLAGEWTYCLRAEGVTFAGDAEAVESREDIDGAKANVWVQDARRRAAAGYVSIEKALQETCKYLTKSASWLKLPEADLLEVAEVERWPRMFELLGAARETHAGEVETPAEVEPGGDSHDAQGEASLLDTQSLSAGEPSEGESRGAGTGAGDSERGATWRQLLGVLPFDDWLRLLDSQVARSQRYRKAMLAKKYFCASFVTLAGEAFGAEPETGINTGIAGRDAA